MLLALLLATAVPVDALPAEIGRNYAAAQGALRAGDDELARARWEKARALFDALPPATRLAPGPRDAAVRWELSLANEAKKRFDAIGPATTLESAAARFAEKQRLFTFLVGADNALDEAPFVGAWRRVLGMKQSLRGLHCQWGDLMTRYERWLADLPCSPDLGPEECRLYKSYTAENGSFWHDEIERQYAACRF